MLISRLRFFAGKVNEIGGSSCNNRSFYSQYFAWDHFCGYPLFIVFIGWNIIFRKFLILWLTEFLFCIKVYPKLKAQTWSFKARRHFCMYDTLSSRHPLYISWPNNSFVPFEIFMIYLSLLHISDSLKTTVRMIRESGWQLNIKIIKQEKRVKIL